MLGLEETFDASSGWLIRLKQLHGIRHMANRQRKISKPILNSFFGQRVFVTLLVPEMFADTEASGKLQNISAGKNA